MVVLVSVLRPIAHRDRHRMARQVRASLASELEANLLVVALASFYNVDKALQRRRSNPAAEKSKKHISLSF